MDNYVICNCINSLFIEWLHIVLRNTCVFTLHNFISMIIRKNRIDFVLSSHWSVCPKIRLVDSICPKSADMRCWTWKQVLTFKFNFWCFSVRYIPIVQGHSCLLLIGWSDSSTNQNRRAVNYRVVHPFIVVYSPFYGSAFHRVATFWKDRVGQLSK